MRRSSDTQIVAGAAAVALALWAAGAGLLSRTEPVPAVSGAAPEFDAARALEVTRALVTRHPRRVLGSIEARQSSGALRDRLAALGYAVEFGHFGAVIAGRRQVGRNVWGLRPGASPEIVVVVAHYDTAPTSVQGATDNGAGVGVLLELARLAAAQTPRRTLIFLASDGEEWGMLGARDFVRTFSGRDRIVAALSLDVMAPGEIAALRLDAAGQGSGFAPAWIRELGRAAAAVEGLPVRLTSDLGERLDHALDISWSDQGPFVAAGIPALNLGGCGRDPGLERATAHSAGDTLDRLDPASLGAYGRSAERILRGLVDLPALPASAADLRVIGGRYLAPFWTSILDALLFAPLALAFALGMVRHRADVTRGAAAREALDFACVALPLALGYGAIRFAELLRWLPRYALYPATLGDPLLERPAWGVIGGVAVVVLAAGALCGLARHLAARALPRPGHGAARTLVLGIAVAVAALALAYDSSWAVAFLLLPAWAWMLIGSGRSPARRAANRVLLVAAGVVWYGVTLGFARALGLGWKVLWCEMLALSTGLFRPAGVLLGVAAAAVGVRMIAIQSLRDEPRGPGSGVGP